MFSKNASTPLLRNITKHTSPSSLIHHQLRNYASVEKMMRLKRFKGNIHKKVAVANWLKYRKQTEGMMSQQVKEIRDRNRKAALPQWKPETPFEEAYQRYIYELHFIPKKPFKDTRLIEMLQKVEKHDDMIRLMQLWRICLRRPVRFTNQFSEALVDKLLQYDEVEAAANIVAAGRHIFMPISRSLTQRVVQRLAKEQQYDLILSIFQSATRGLLTFQPQKEDYLFFLRECRGQEVALKLFYTHPVDVAQANQLLPQGHEEESYSLMLDTCEQQNATRIAEHIYHEMMYQCADNKTLLTRAETLVKKLREEHPVAEEEASDEGEEKAADE